MIISKYGIRLERLRNNADLELVRVMRNSNIVKSGMFFQDTITAEMQQRWFNSQNNKNNYHFLIEVAGKKIGLISGKNVDFINGNSEGGIFIWDTEYLGSPAPVIASVIMAELTFHLLGLNTTYAEARTDNKASLNYNRLLGYESLQTIVEEGKVKMKLTRENFIKHGHKFLSIIRKATGDTEPLSWNNIHFVDRPLEEKHKLYKGFPEHIQHHIDRHIG